ncbi:MAG: RHS repeat-associated core domain-containing protein [Deltaproteobacteria bacterium]|nr:RHS repeat-associated core domain-containing protein [Deltaproteobacteria bacterium]
MISISLKKFIAIPLIAIFSVTSFSSPGFQIPSVHAAAWAPDSPSKPSVSTLRYYSWDHLGSTRVVTDGLGSEQARYSYYPYGEMRGNWDLVQLPSYSTYTSQKFDTESNLYYYGARYYDPKLARFVSADPIVTLEPYAYSRNNPLYYTDPDGNFAQAAVAPLLPFGPVGWGLAAGILVGVTVYGLWATGNLPGLEGIRPVPSPSLNYPGSTPVTLPSQPGYQSPAVNTKNAPFPVTASPSLKEVFPDGAGLLPPPVFLSQDKTYGEDHPIVVGIGQQAPRAYLMLQRGGNITGVTAVDPALEPMGFNPSVEELSITAGELAELGYQGMRVFVDRPGLWQGNTVTSVAQMIAMQEIMEAMTLVAPGGTLIASYDHDDISPPAIEILAKSGWGLLAADEMVQVMADSGYFPTGREVVGYRKPQ